ncbi:hypothetical protein FDECE_8633 [Fusarium decemcellulare]|nr:hypothetical protein FDECE_8633 [Fusarium decemcellulare]
MRLPALILSATALVAAAPWERSVDVRLMTYNIRLAVKPSKLQPNEEPWSVRRKHMSAQLNYETAGRPESLICMQEATYPQIQDLQEDFGSEWTYVGGGRDDGRKKGEGSPIFYRPEVWDLEQSKLYWLSQTPDRVGSKGWDANLPRIATVARFRHINTGARVVYMCTHFDHKGQTARENSANLLIHLADRWASHKRGNLPVFLAGDLNVQPDNKAYKTLASEMYDLRKVVPQERHFGHIITYTGFRDDGAHNMFLDHIFVRDPAGLDFRSYAVLNSRYEDGVFISDHRPVVVDFRITQIARRDY